MGKIISSLQKFFTNAWLSYIALMYWTTPITYIASHIIAPLTYIIFFYYLGISATGIDTGRYYLIGNAIQLCSLNGIYGMTMAIGGERDTGTLSYLVVSPSSRLSIFLGRTFFNFIDGVLTVIIGLGWGVLLGLDLGQANWVGILSTICITTLSACGLGILMGSISLLSVNVLFINNTVYYLLLLFCGVNLPLESLPEWMGIVSSFLPLTRGVKAVRLFSEGVSFDNSTIFLLIGEFSIGLAYGILGYVTLVVLERKARQKGTLDAI